MISANRHLFSHSILINHRRNAWNRKNNIVYAGMQFPIVVALGFLQ
jgi:hypothetical protein